MAMIREMAQIRSTRREWRWIAMPSIVLNIFLTALIVGQMNGASVTPPAKDPIARVLASAEASLPPSDAAAFRQALLSDEPRYANAAKGLAVARRELAVQIAADPFNRDAIQRALVGLRMAWNAFFDALNEPIVGALAKVSPEGRRKAFVLQSEDAGTNSHP